MNELIKCVVLSALTHGDEILLPAGEGAEPVTVDLTQAQIDILRPLGVVRKVPKSRKSKTAASPAPVGETNVEAAETATE